MIFVFVVLWTCFPEAYASIMLTLFVPLTLAVFGIVLRGASFAFRKAVTRVREQRIFGGTFVISSVLCSYASVPSPAESPPDVSPPAAERATRGTAGSSPNTVQLVLQRCSLVVCLVQGGRSRSRIGGCRIWCPSGC